MFEIAQVTTEIRGGLYLIQVQTFAGFRWHSGVRFDDASDLVRMDKGGIVHTLDQ